MLIGIYFSKPFIRVSYLEMFSWATVTELLKNKDKLLVAVIPADTWEDGKSLMTPSEHSVLFPQLRATMSPFLFVS